MRVVDNASRLEAFERMVERKNQGFERMVI